MMNFDLMMYLISEILVPGHHPLVFVDLPPLLEKHFLQINDPQLELDLLLRLCLKKKKWMWKLELSHRRSEEMDLTKPETMQSEI